MVNSRDMFLIVVLLRTSTILRFVLVMARELVTPNVMVAFSGV